MFSRESKVRLSEVAVLAQVMKEVFQAGVDATKLGPAPEQFMMTPEQILAEQARMEADAAWIVSGGGSNEPEAPEDD